MQRAGSRRDGDRECLLGHAADGRPCSVALWATVVQEMQECKKARLQDLHAIENNAKNLILLPSLETETHIS